MSLMRSSTRLPAFLFFEDFRPELLARFPGFAHFGHWPKRSACCWYDMPSTVKYLFAVGVKLIAQNSLFLTAAF
jgi:hypothetical protein